MQLAATLQTYNDPIITWQAANGVAWCNRMTAKITHATCEENQRKFGYLRCQNCGGLDSQPEPRPECPSLVIVRSKDLEPVATTVIETLTGTGANDLDETEIDELLADLFQEDEDCEDEEQREVAYLEDAPEATNRRVAVYIGRCIRCNGYMANDREKQFDVRDEDVYRCFTCGWRISPRYANNRVLFARGVEVK